MNRMAPQQAFVLSGSSFTRPIGTSFTSKCVSVFPKKIFPTGPSMTAERLLANNKEWAKKMQNFDPNFFPDLAKAQFPDYLWLGCSDSRIPVNQLCDVFPGEIFVHRNIANLVINSDLSSLSVMEFSINVLKVKHVIVCGHYGCGGVKASMGDASVGLIDNWLRHIRDVQVLYKDELDALKDEDAKFKRLCELNVIQQVKNVTSSTIVQKCWARGQPLSVHGFVYDLESGTLVDLKCDVDGQNGIDPRYKYNNLA